jgi:hypothetical protein
MNCWLKLRPNCSARIRNEMSLAPARPVGRHQPNDPRRPVTLGKRRKACACGEAGGDGPQQGSACDFHECLFWGRLEGALQPVASIPFIRAALA